MGIKTLKDALTHWTDWEEAAYQLAFCLGIINPEKGYSGHKRVFWTANPLLDLLSEILEKMVGLGILEERDESDTEYRWNPSFEANQFVDDAWAKVLQRAEKMNATYQDGKLIYKGTVVSIFIGSQKGASKTSIPSAELIPEHGVSGDHHAGTKPHRQVSLFASETLQEIHAAGIDVAAEDLSTNLLTEGIAIDMLSAGTKLKIGAAIIEISEARKPCGSLTKIDKRLPKATYLRCGQFGRVITGGVIHVGDAIEIL